MTETYNFSPSLKKIAFGLMALGVLGLLIGFIVYKDHNNRVWANILLNSYYMCGIALAAVFFLAVHQIGYSGWHMVIRRIPEAMSTFIPVAGIGLLVVLLGVILHAHHLYHWTDASLYKEFLPNGDPNPHYDSIIAGKASYLNVPFFSLRIITYVVIWSLLAIALRRISIQEDQLGGIQPYNKGKYLSAVFILFFAVTSSTGSWDLILSIDTHWYSTLFGWYNFASYMAASVAVMILILIYLKSQGFLSAVNENHLHDLGKYLFGFSVFWTYLWFSQFLLIWYGNIPEATVYYSNRMESGLFKTIFYGNVLISFLFPFLILMTRNSKRSMETLVLVSIVVIIGHWLDFFNMIMPGAVGKDEAGIGWLEISTFLGFTGLFIYVVFQALTKASLVPVNNPHLKESLQHHT